jgi:hypothetical protein
VRDFGLPRFYVDWIQPGKEKRPGEKDFPGNGGDYKSLKNAYVAGGYKS